VINTVWTLCRSLFQKDRQVGFSTKLPTQRTHSLDQRAWLSAPPTNKFDDTDEEAQSPMVTSHNGTTPGLPGIPPAMTSSLCSSSSVGEEVFACGAGAGLGRSV